MQPQLTPEKIMNLANRNNIESTYWEVIYPNASPIKLVFANNYVNRFFPNAVGVDRFVYWPDYKVAGQIKNIVNVFRNAGVEKVNVGFLYKISNGNFGCYPQVQTLSEDLVKSCSIDPLDSNHQFMINELINSTPLEYKELLSNIQKGNLDYSLGDELTYLSGNPKIGYYTIKRSDPSLSNKPFSYSGK